jgi:hypothetical protein
VKRRDGFTHKYHPQPRLSANQVGDYLSANATNRRRILRDAKYPPTMLLIRYEDARSALVSHLTSNGVAENILDKKVQTLRRNSDNDGITDYQKQNCRLCIDAIESFQSFEAKMDVGSAKFLKSLTHYPRLKISGVSISVSIDLRTEKIDSKGGKTVGAAMLVFSKSGGPDNNLPERCKAAALLVHELVKRYVKSSEKCDPTLCMAIDVFNGKVYRAKSQQKLLYKTVENSCGEVATVWPSVEPPPNYNGPPIPKD